MRYGQLVMGPAGSGKVIESALSIKNYSNKLMPIPVHILRNDATAWIR